MKQVTQSHSKLLYKIDEIPSHLLLECSCRHHLVRDMYEGWEASPPFLWRKDKDTTSHMVYFIMQTYCMPLLV